MDPRRLLSRAAMVAVLTPGLAACAILRPHDTASPAPIAAEPAPILPEDAPSAPPLETAVMAPFASAPPVDLPPMPSGPVLEGRAALTAAARDARALSRSDGFQGGLQVFAFAPGRIYEVWTAPLRVTVLTLPPGETVTSLAAGDTVRWQIAEAASGAAGAGLTHVLIKPLEAGLETNLILTTTARVYLVHLRSGRVAEGFNTAVTWDVPAAVSPPHAVPEAEAPQAAVTTPEGPVHEDYGIAPRGRRPNWTPIRVVDDGARTFITLAPSARQADTPALFVLTPTGEAELVNYRQVEGVLVVDRLFDRAELRHGDRRPQVVVLTRRGAPR